MGVAAFGLFAVLNGTESLPDCIGVGFTAGFAPQMLGPMIIAKLVGGISAAALALLLTRNDK